MLRRLRHLRVDDLPRRHHALRLRRETAQEGPRCQQLTNFLLQDLVPSIARETELTIWVRRGRSGFNLQKSAECGRARPDTRLSRDLTQGFPAAPRHARAGTCTGPRCLRASRRTKAALKSRRKKASNAPTDKGHETPVPDDENNKGRGLLDREMVVMVERLPCLSRRFG